MICYRLLDRASSPHPKRSLHDCLGDDMFILPGASLFTKEAFEKVGCFDERLSGYEDDDLFLRMFSAGMRSVFLENKSVTKWRIYSGSTSYSPRMMQSRMIYFRKLVDAYPDDHGIDAYWARDFIAPRFLDKMVRDYLAGVEAKNLDRAARAWDGIKEIVPFLRSKAKRRFYRISWLIEIFPRGRFAARLFRRAIKRKAARRR